jgi:cytochrome c-type biogenesis protein CcmH/NrfF
VNQHLSLPLAFAASLFLLAATFCGSPAHAMQRPAAALMARPAAAQSGIANTVTTVDDVARELVCNCPDCGKQAIDQCEHCAVSRKFKGIIARQLHEGKSKDQILTSIANTYGEQMLGNPRPVGFNRIATLMPAFAALLGFAALSGFWGRRRKRDREIVAGNPDRLGTDDLPEDPRVAAALRDLD